MHMDPIGTDLIPMGSLGLRSALIASLQAGSTPSNNLLETQPEQDLVAALIVLQHANILHYRYTSCPETLVVYGTNSVFRYPSDLTRSSSLHRQAQVDKVKAALSTVLSRITTLPSTPENTFKQDKEKRLIDIYFDMPSPQLSSGLVDHFSGTVDKATQDLLNSIISRDSPHGMETKLYEYQKKSLWKMAKRELCPGHILDPTVIPMTDAEGNDYYIDFSNDRLGVYRSPTRKWEDVRGGILCEDMGTGKTCICIALILLTRHQLSMPPSPCTVYLSPAATTSTSTLEDSTECIRSNMIDFQQFREQIRTYGHSEDSLFFYRHSDSIEGRSARLNERKQKEPEVEIYLTKATLVIVPDALVDQWCNEIIKHAERSGLRPMELTSRTKNIPEAKELASYDIVLITQARFATEYDPGTYSHKRQSQDRPDCDCQALYKHCTCPRPRPTISSLMQVQWKRIIVDEGHTMSAELSDHALLASKLHTERRWICTGTPTSNLVNLDPDRSQSMRTWTDKSDLTRLASLAAFLQVGPYAKNKNLFLNQIRDPFIDCAKASLADMSLEALSSVKRLSHLLERLMTRNRPEDIKKFAPLPDLHEHVVILRLEHFQILSLNCLIALVQANAVLSQREDQDYFFHPRNKKSLRRTIDNLNNCCFWYSGDGESFTTLAMDTLHNVENALEAHNRSKYPPDDVALLEGVVQNLQLALSDDSWKTLIAEQDLGYFCRLPETMQQETLIPSSYLTCAAPGSGEKACIMLADQIRVLNQNLRGREGPPTMIDGAEQISNARILSSTSSKLNYIINQILHHREEKCIVFCQSSSAIYYIQEYLSLAKVRCLTYHKQGMKQSERSSNIMTFNTSENVRAIIMDVQHAAFGIDLSSATRVYFVSPVWQTATMRQAVKRAHRIGQTRPVYIETLIIGGSFEEEIWNKRIEHDETPLKAPWSSEHLRDNSEGSSHIDDDTGGPAHVQIPTTSTTTPLGKFQEVFSHLKMMPLSVVEQRENGLYPVSSDHVPIEGTSQGIEETVRWSLKNLPVPLITVPRGWLNAEDREEDVDLKEEDRQDNMEAGASLEDRQDDIGHLGLDLKEDHQDYDVRHLGLDLKEDLKDDKTVLVSLSEDHQDTKTKDFIDLKEEDQQDTLEVIDLTEDGIDEEDDLVQLKEEDITDVDMEIDQEIHELEVALRNLKSAKEERRVAREKLKAAREEANRVFKKMSKVKQEEAKTTNVRVSSSPPTFVQVKREIDLDPSSSSSSSSMPCSKRVRGMNAV
ncbi:hypothetical protein CPC16_003549 [Podila verticillata]|nr:hypothetical protein CPC16_003549 [Podila verticillata]